MALRLLFAPFRVEAGDGNFYLRVSFGKFY
jgi:hypothetical protein